MLNDLMTFAEDLHETARSSFGEGSGSPYYNDSFTEVVSGYLIEDGALEGIEPCYFRKETDTGRGAMEVFGYFVGRGGSVLDVVAGEPNRKAEVLRKAEVQRVLRRARNFVERCRQGVHLELAETDRAHPMALAIHRAWPDLTRIRIFLVTDGRVTVDTWDEEEIAGLRCNFELWDIARLYRLAASGRQEEDTVIDLDPPLAYLPVQGDEDYSCLLTAVPGAVLAELYDQHGAKLLQRNVRAYLQARTKVNKGIGETVRNAPGRFLAYNNGVSATASAVVTESGIGGAQQISRLVNLQIVNGGQTTASLHHLWTRDPRSLDRVSVPAKITVVGAEALDELVSEISRCANSQNAIKEADFQANGAFHVALEKLSRSLWIPAREGSTVQSRWYYERVRGQYQVDLSQQDRGAKQRIFRTENPVAQRFGKTDLAKYEMTYLGRPHDVSLGGEKCFQIWTAEVLGATEDQIIPDRQYFHELIAKAILFGRTRKIIQSLKLGGYLGQTAAYVMSLVVDRYVDQIDLDEIWRTQDLPAWLRGAIPGLAGDIVRPLLVDAPGAANVTEWCKKEACWQLVRASS
ncbi:AIPR family protein [Streptomyces sp. NPDC059445]|uniref:AIPR family protein n=1 Tax=Streptomyces sp. NPDC059445 TaxID=3346832 RepID=UPI0036B366AE